MDGRAKLKARPVLVLTAALTAGLMVLRLGWIEPARPEIDPQGWAALPFAALLALGLAVFVLLAFVNRGRWRAVLRPSRGRVIGALVLGFVTPATVINWGPWSLGPIAALTLFSERGYWASGLFFLASGLLYPVSCLLVSGIHRRPLRVLMFALPFWDCYSAILLWQGTRGL